MSEYFFNNNTLNVPEFDKPNQPPVEQIDQLLENNNLMRKRLPEEKGSLLKAVSDSLYFTTNFHEETQQNLIKHLKNLIATNKLPPKMAMFKGNSILLKDFVMSPHLPGFEKINLELISSLYKVRVIVYGATEDNYLSSMIINQKYHKTIELLRTKNNHYDPVYSLDYMTKAGVCQNIILNLIDQALTGKKDYKDLNKDNYINYEYNNWIQSQQAQNGLDQFRITRGRHKKSFSDNFNKNFDAMEDQQMKIYNMFMNMKPPEDFLDKINVRKDTAESNFSINADLGFVDEGWQDPVPNNREYAIKNYPIPQTNNFRKNVRASSPQPQRNRPINQNNIYFRENLTLAEIEKLEKAPHKDPQTISPAYFVNVEPPGLTPTRFIQSYNNFSDALPTSTNALENNSPTLKTRSNLHSLQNLQMDYSENGPQNSYPMGYQPMSSQHQQVYNNPYLKRADSTPSYPMNPQQMMQYGQPQVSVQNHFMGVPKKKAMIMEDGSRRYSGRLKFF